MDTDPGRSAESISLLENEAPLRLARSLHLVPARSLGVWRRALALALLSWLPIMVWALVSGHLAEVATGESLLHHYAVHVRCLVLMPLLVLAEPLFDHATRQLSGQLADGVFGSAAERERLREANEGLLRLRNATWPWIVILGLVLAWTAAFRAEALDHAMSWASDRDGRLGFGGLWFGYVVRPISVVLLLAWFWRLVLVTIWYRRIARLRPQLVPTHPDRAGGIGFLQDILFAFPPVTLAITAMLSAHWAHEMLQHGATLASFKGGILVFCTFWTLLLLTPLLVFSPLLMIVRRRSLLAYSSLVGRQGRLVHQRWIEGRDVGEQPILQAPEIGPVADAGTLFQAVHGMRGTLIGLRTLIGIVLPIALPLIVLATLQVPMRELLLQLLKLLA